MRIGLRATSLPDRLLARLLLVFVLLVGSAWPTLALACEIKPYPDAFPVDSTQAAALPAAPMLALASLSVRRSRHAPPGSGDCGEIGSLVLQFTQSDGSAWPDDVGVRLSVVRGALPQTFPIPDYPVLTFAIPDYPMLTTQGSLDFAGGDDPAQAIDFTLRATGVNAGGVESAPIEIHVSDSGRSSGCSMSGAEPGWALPVGLALCALAFRRARRRA